MPYPIHPYFWLYTVFAYDNKLFFGYFYNASTVEIFDIPTGNYISSEFDIPGTVAVEVTIYNGNVFVVRSNSTISKHDYVTKALIKSDFIAPASTYPVSVGVYNGLLYVSLGTGSINVYNPDSGNLVKTIAYTRVLRSLSFSNGKLYGCVGGNVVVIDVSSGTVLDTQFLGITNGNNGLSIIGKYMFVSGTKLYDMDTGQVLQTYPVGGIGITTYGTYLYVCQYTDACYRFDITPYAFTAPITPVINYINASWQGIASIYFTQPTSSSSATITGYSYSLNGGSTFTNTVTTTSPITLSGLALGVTLQICIKALSNSSGESPVSNIINVTPTYPCFKQGTRILAFNQETQEAEYIPVERLRKGDLVKTYARGYIPISVIGHTVLQNPKDDSKKDNRLYRFTPDMCPELEEDLFITGNHCVLWQRLSTTKREQVEEHMGKVYVTEGKYRVPAFLDDRAKPYREAGPATIWHFALENNNIYDNYGVFANGLLVESSSLRYMTEFSNMELVECPRH